MPRGGPRPNSGGKRPGSGRKKGSGTKKTLKTNVLAEKAAGEGALPLEVLLRRMREADNAGHTAIACELAIAAAPYCHRRLAAIAHSGPQGGPIRLVEELVIVDGNAEPQAACPSSAGELSSQ